MNEQTAQFLYSTSLQLGLSPTQDTKQALKNIEDRCAQQVCGGGYITKAEADPLWKLRAEVGMKYDAVNCCLEPLDAE